MVFSGWQGKETFISEGLILDIVWTVRAEVPGDQFLLGKDQFSVGRKHLNANFRCKGIVAFFVPCNR